MVLNFSRVDFFLIILQQLLFSLLQLLYGFLQFALFALQLLKLCLLFINHIQEIELVLVHLVELVLVVLLRKTFNFWFLNMLMFFKLNLSSHPLNSLELVKFLDFLDLYLWYLLLQAFNFFLQN